MKTFKTLFFLLFFSAVFSLFRLNASVYIPVDNFSAVGPFLSLHRSDNRLYVEIPLIYLSRDLLIASGISKTTDPQWMDIGVKVYDPLLVRFSIEGGSLYLREARSEILYDKNDPLLHQTMQNVYMDRYIARFEIEEYLKDSTAVLADMTDLFVGDLKDLSPFPWHFNKAKHKFNKELSRLGEIKAFEDNVTVKSIISYSIEPEKPSWSSYGNVSSAELTRTILLLPEEPMKPRLADSRIGLFTQEMTVVDYSASDQINKVKFAQRWLLEPSDSAAWQRGELVEPRSPVTFYVDNGFPEDWKKGIKEGVLAWNAAFEKIGFRNAIVAKDFPVDDPGFDPDNLKYSCLRFIPIDKPSARGPSWVDPRSGEIINATVSVWGDISESMNAYRFIRTAQVDPRVRSKKMPVEVMQESIKEIIVHEIGHTLGLAHNMTASAAFPVDSLRSASFTAQYGTTPSIMDYAHFNYIAQPADTGVTLARPSAGIYDELCIKYLYTPLSGEYTVVEEAKIAESWIDEKADDPMYRYFNQQWNPVYDPSNMTNDLGDDPQKAGDYGIKNLKYIVDSLNVWLPGDELLEHRKKIYAGIARQYSCYLGFVSYNIGGIYLSNVKPEQAGKVYEAVARERQKESLKWLVRELKNCDWIDKKEVISQFPPQVAYAAEIRKNHIRSLLGRADQVLFSSHLSDNPYPLREYLDDLYRLVWQALIENRRPSEVEKVLQLELVKGLISLTRNESSGNGLSRHFESVYNTGSTDGYVCCREHSTAFYDPYAYNFLRTLDLSAIDNKMSWYRLTCEKIEKLVKRRLKSAYREDIDHYHLILLLLKEDGR